MIRKVILINYPNLWAFGDSLDHGKVDKDPRGEDTEENWLEYVNEIMR